MSKLQAGFRYEDRLEGFSNYSPWKERIKLVLQIHKIWEFAKKEIKKPTDHKDLKIFKDLDTRVRVIILDGVKDALIPHLSKKNNAHEMWMALHNLFQNKNKNWVLVLEDKLNSTKMIKGESVTLYLKRLSQVKDELASIGVTISNGDMVTITLKGLIEEWKPFIKGIVSREKCPDYNRLWDEFIKEEL